MLFHIVDIETTGMNRITDDILEVGYIRCDQNYRIIGHGTLYFYKPEYQIENPGAQAVHKLTREFLKQYEGDFDKNLAALYALIRNSCFIGKNSDSFDLPFLKEFIGKNIPELYATASPLSTLDIQKVFAPRFREWYKQAYGSSVKRAGRLEEYMAVIGYTDERVKREFMEAFPEEAGRSHAHAALYDVFMTYLAFKHREE